MDIIKLIEEEVASRAKQRKKIQKLIEDHCFISPSSKLSRQEFQNFCSKHLFNDKCPVNLSFQIYLNKLMPELGYPLGQAHGGVGVYRGLTWK